jgi:hypothetical protein
MHALRATPTHQASATRTDILHQDRARTKIDDVFDAMAEIGPTHGNPVSGLRSTDPASHSSGDLVGAAQRALDAQGNGII